MDMLIFLLSSLITRDDVTNTLKMIQRQKMTLCWTKISLFGKYVKNSRISVKMIFLEEGI